MKVLPDVVLVLSNGADVWHYDAESFTPTGVANLHHSAWCLQRRSHFSYKRFYFVMNIDCGNNEWRKVAVKLNDNLSFEELRLLAHVGPTLSVFWDNLGGSRSARCRRMRSEFGFSSEYTFLRDADNKVESSYPVMEKEVPTYMKVVTFLYTELFPDSAYTGVYEKFQLSDDEECTKRIDLGFYRLDRYREIS